MRRQIIALAMILTSFGAKDFAQAKVCEAI
jgi:hypothetical protein